MWLPLSQLAVHLIGLSLLMACSAGCHSVSFSDHGVVALYDRGEAVTALAGLGTFTAVRMTFKSKVGNKITYSFVQHSYEVEVVRSVKPWEEAY